MGACAEAGEGGVGGLGHFWAVFLHEVLHGPTIVPAGLARCSSSQTNDRSTNLLGGNFEHRLSHLTDREVPRLRVPVTNDGDFSGGWRLRVLGDWLRVRLRTPAKQHHPRARAMSPLRAAVMASPLWMPSLSRLTTVPRRPCRPHQPHTRAGNRGKTRECPGTESSMATGRFG